MPFQCVNGFTAVINYIGLVTHLVKQSQGHFLIDNIVIGQQHAEWQPGPQSAVDAIRGGGCRAASRRNARCNMQDGCL